MQTIDEAFRTSIAAFPENVAMRYYQDETWEQITYSDMSTAVTKTVLGLVNLGIGTDSKVAIMSENRPEWIVSYLAIVTTGATAVPIDAQLGEDETGHILGHSEAGTIICSTGCYDTLSRIIGGLDTLKTIIIYDRNITLKKEHNASGDGKSTAENGGKSHERKRFMSYDELIESGACGDSSDIPPLPEKTIDSLTSIIYTSGTTGTAKGVMLTHKNIMANVESITHTIAITGEDGLLLLLPLHHSFPFTTCMVWPLTKGASINFVDIMSRERTRLIMECEPTIMVGVPMLYSKIYKNIIRQVESSTLKNMLFKYGGRKIIGKALKKKLGGRLRYMISGAAPMEPDVIEGIKGLGIEFLEGYGLTETSPVVSVNSPGAIKIGSVGPPLWGVESKVLDPDSDGIGEIAIKGDNVMQGYYRNPEQTDAVLKDGWFQSGDLGRIDDDGYIFITGRAKDVIVNPGGKNVYPDVVETQILKSRFIAEAVVIGYKAADERGEHVGVLVYPDYEELMKYAKDNETPLKESGDAVITEDAKDEMIDTFRALLESEVKNSMSKLASFQQATRIGIERDEFEKTSTKKIKRFLYKGRLDIHDVPQE